MPEIDQIFKRQTLTKIPKQLFEVLIINNDND